MKAEPANHGYRDFRKVIRKVYSGNPCYRGTENSLVKMIVNGPTGFHTHARIAPFILTDGNDTAGCFALIADQKLPGVVQVAFFEALPGLGDLMSVIRDTARRLFPECNRIIAGLNGHLNYGAGFLLNRHDEPPVFGLPYTPAWYPGYFKALEEKRMVSFCFSVEEIRKWSDQRELPARQAGLHTRNMDKKEIRREIALYTKLNNGAFQDHPYWADRTETEDFELFHPFRHFLDNDNLIFAEIEGKPAGFFLWYPDFNQLAKGHHDLGLAELVSFRLKSRIDTFRFTEIGILPGFRKSQVAFAMIRHSLPYLEKKGLRYCEAGFIFEQNRDSMALAMRMVSRSFGAPPEPYRRYAVYEGKL